MARRIGRAFFVLLVVLAAFGAGPAVAKITVTSAKISAGKLIVTGKSPTGASVKLDGSYSAIIKPNRTFRFAIVYVPKDCVVDLTLIGAAAPTKQAAVANCAVSGIAQVYSLASNLGLGPYNNHSIYVFAGTPAEVDLAAGQTITASANLTLATSSGVAPTRVMLCHKLSSAANPTNFTSGAYSVVVIDSARHTHSVSATVSNLAPGHYTVGACLYNPSATAINNNDYMSGWVMVHN